ncbi:histidine phosphatase family protein [Streptomyces sp. NPDC005706]|uniref:histidine phosphatase family protein n=1 Tax=Streptomyces sp. NPDC005706 TaxID=3157169 RepID=UPI0033F54554
MTTRVMLISPAMNPALREARFDDGCSLDAAGAARARSAADGLRPAAVALVSPTARCRETAAALGLDARAEPALAGLGMGRWRGRTLEEVGAAEPEALARWLADPAASPHGGESVRLLCARVGGWLEEAARSAGRTVAVVEPEVVRAVTVRVLGAPEAAFWRIDVPPLTAAGFTGRAGRWNLTPATVLGGTSGTPEGAPDR